MTQILQCSGGHPAICCWRTFRGSFVRLPGGQAEAATVELIPEAC